MGIYHSFGVNVGFRMKLSEALKPFEIRTPEEFYMEPRFDPRTGKAVDPTKVVTRPEWIDYVVNGEAFDHGPSAVEGIARFVGARLGVIGSYSLNSYDRVEVLFGLASLERNEVDNFTIMTVNDTPIPLSQVPHEELAQIRKKLEELGLPVGEPVISLTWYYG